MADFDKDGDSGLAEAPEMEKIEAERQQGLMLMTGYALMPVIDFSVLSSEYGQYTRMVLQLKALGLPEAEVTVQPVLAMAHFPELATFRFDTERVDSTLSVFLNVGVEDVVGDRRLLVGICSGEVEKIPVADLERLLQVLFSERLLAHFNGERGEEGGFISIPQSPRTKSGSRRKIPAKRFALLALVLLGVGLVGYGAISAYLKPTDPLQRAMASDDFKGVQDAIRAQIADAAKTGVPGGFALKGQNNVTLDTLRAMGLNPGQANAGCLVGTK